jgi:hypothetical protein
MVVIPLSENASSQSCCYHYNDGYSGGHSSEYGLFDGSGIGYGNGSGHGYGNADGEGVLFRIGDPFGTGKGHARGGGFFDSSGYGDGFGRQVKWNWRI